MEKSVTIIIAAYKRIKPLKLALESVYNQSYPHWKILLVADCCDDEFISQFKGCHPKVSIINLDQRCGNQYGPNSLGIHLATTKYITFLNHDDILLSDHLSTAIEALESQNADFFLGAGAYCHFKNQEKHIQQEQRLLFSEKNRSHAIWRCLEKKYNPFFEPSSSIIMETELAKRAGYWNSPSQTSTTPLLDWISRILRCQPVISYSDKVTTLKFNLHHIQPRGGGDYSVDPYVEYIPYYINEDPESTRDLIKQDLALARERRLKVRPLFRDEPVCEEEMESMIQFINFLSGKASTDFRSGGAADSGERFLKVVENRTGERLPGFVPAEEIISRFERGKP